MTDFSEMFEKIFKEKERLKDMQNKDENQALTESTEDFLKNNLIILKKIQKIFYKLSETEKNEELILALKPLLNQKLQKKADESIKMLKIFSIMPILKEKGILN